MTSRAALLLVDLQKDFLTHPELEPDAATLISRVEGLLAWFREQGWPIAHIHTNVATDRSNAMPHWRNLDRDFCIQGTPGAESPTALCMAPGENVYVKQYYDGFEDSNLARDLVEAGIDTVVIAGVHTHACVRSTAVSAYRNGFTPLIPVDALGTYDPVHGALTREWLHGRVAQCMTIRSIKALLKAAPATEACQDYTVWHHHDPADWKRLLGVVPLMGQEEIDAAVMRLKGWQSKWARISLVDRVKRLEVWRSILESGRERWVSAIVRNVGKPRRDAEGEVAYGLALLDNVCRTACDEEEDQGRRVRYHPRGTVGLITPWNNPFAIPVSKIAPALAYGNSVLWKPALSGSLIAQMINESLHAAGLGQWIEVITGDATAGEALVGAPEIAAISFTGSVAVGQKIARRSGQLLLPLQAELGGNNAALVLADADLESTARELAVEMFSFAGQRCTAIRRLIVEDEVYSSFSEAFISSVLALRTGAPEDQAVHVGPVISKEHQEFLLQLVYEARDNGATLLAGGSPPDNCPVDGCWIAPTILADLPKNSPILRNELFGPVVALTRTKGLDAALEEHNRGPFGLLGALFSHDRAAQKYFLAEAQAGILVLNSARPAFSASGPFFGWKSSGNGMPEHGRWSRDFFTKVQALYG